MALVGAAACLLVLKRIYEEKTSSKQLEPSTPTSCRFQTKVLKSPSSSSPNPTNPPGFLPLGFVAICVWIILFELPRRLEMADVQFLRACSFLFVRFRRSERDEDVVFWGAKTAGEKNMLHFLREKRNNLSIHVVKVYSNSHTSCPKKNKKRKQNGSSNVTASSTSHVCTPLLRTGCRGLLGDLLGAERLGGALPLITFGCWEGADSVLKKRVL